jgi:REP element-mobilizing transposase RayT
MTTKYNLDIHHRRSIRLRGYDYSRVGLYFVTICTQHREHFFGHIADGEMILNDAGKMIEKWVNEIPNKFSDIKIEYFVVMPNHFHVIIENVGAHLRVRPNNNNVRPDNNEGRHTGLPLHDVLGEHDPVLGEHVGSPLRAVIQWFKTMTTNEYIRGVKTLEWQPFDRKMWQRNYWEHIIRNDNSYHTIAEYILTNPQRWDSDELNIANSNQK